MKIIKEIFYFIGILVGVIILAKVGWFGYAAGFLVFGLTAFFLMQMGYNHIKTQYIKGTSNPNKVFTGSDNLGSDGSYPNQKNYPPLPTTYYNENFKKEMPLYLRDFYIQGSFRTYAPRGYTNDIANLKTIGYVIQKGPRVIYLDVSHDGRSPLDQNANPIVQCPQPMPGSKPLKFTNCLDIINKNAWSNNNYPLILYLNMDSNTIQNKNVCHKIAEQISEVFSSRLLPMKYSFNRVPLGDVPISDCQGRIIVLVNNYPNTTLLDELTNGVISTGKYAHIKDIPYSHHNIDYGGFKATFHNTQELVDYNQSAMSFIHADPSYKNQFNITQPGIDVYNFDTLEVYKYGCQMVLLSFQKNDDFLKTNIKFFEEGSMKLKPDYLRFIPKPKLPVKKQNKDLSYAPRNNKIVGIYGKPWVNNLNS